MSVWKELREDYERQRPAYVVAWIAALLLGAYFGFTAIGPYLAW